MTRTIITHVGTSVLGCAAFARAPKLDALTNDLTKKGKDRTPHLDTYAPVLEQGLKNTWKPEIDDWKRRQDSPAEIASLSLLDIQASRIILLHSDTHAGRFCAHLLEQVLQQHIGAGYPSCLGNGCSLEVVQIDDLHVNETYQNTSWLGGLLSRQPNQTSQQSERDIFIRKGLVNYVQTITTYYTQMQGNNSEFLFNITAGYKGMIPIARDLALLLTAHSRDVLNCPIRSDVCYLFQNSRDMIRYGALPVQLHWSKILKDNLHKASYPAGVAYNQLRGLDQNQAWEPLFEISLTYGNTWQPYEQALITDQTLVRRSAVGEITFTLYEAQDG